MLLIISSIGLGIAGAIATGLACGWDFPLHLWSKGRCSVAGTPIQVWAGAIASFGIGMKFFWVGLGAWAVWRSRKKA